MTLERWTAVGATAVAALGFGRLGASAAGREGTRQGDMLYRPLGRTGETVSARSGWGRRCARGGGGVVTPIECLHSALDLPTSVVITGIDRPELVDQAVEAVRTYRPMSDAQVAELLARTRTAAADGRYELFKTSRRFDGTAGHPEWLGF